MAAEFRIRDLLHPRRPMLEEAGVGPGMCVLDYGCGPGSYVLPTAEMVGEAGKVYALDSHPLAIGSVRKLSVRRKLKNVVAIFSDCRTGLNDGEADLVLFYDVLHELSDVEPVLQELRRVLKPQGVLSVSDHHLKHEEIVSALTADGLFRLERRNRRTYAFCPMRAAPSDSA